MVIMVQSVVLILLGFASSVEANRGATLGFVEYLVGLYIIDVLWVVSQSVIGERSQRGRGRLYRGVAILNSILVGCLFVLQLSVRRLVRRLWVGLDSWIERLRVYCRHVPVGLL